MPVKPPIRSCRARSCALIITVRVSVDAYLRAKRFRVALTSPFACSRRLLPFHHRQLSVSIRERYLLSFIGFINMSSYYAFFTRLSRGFFCFLSAARCGTMSERICTNSRRASWLPLTRELSEQKRGLRERNALTTPPSAAKPHPPPLTRGGKGLLRFVIAPPVESGIYFTPKGRKPKPSLREIREDGFS